MTTRNKTFADRDSFTANWQKICLIAATSILIVSAAMHASAFGRVTDAVSRSDLESFMGQGLQVLWLADSAVQFVLAFVFASAAFNTKFVSRAGIAVLALIPATIAALLYFFIGNFIGAHLLAAASLSALVSVGRR